MIPHLNVQPNSLLNYLSNSHIPKDIADSKCFRLNLADLDTLDLVSKTCSQLASSDAYWQLIADAIIGNTNRTGFSSDKSIKKRLKKHLKCFLTSTRNTLSYKIKEIYDRNNSVEEKVSKVKKFIETGEPGKLHDHTFIGIARMDPFCGTQLIKAALSLGVNPNACTDYSDSPWGLKSPLHAAMASCNWEAAKELIDFGAAIKVGEKCVFELAHKTLRDETKTHFGLNPYFTSYAGEVKRLQDYANQKLQGDKEVKSDEVTLNGVWQDGEGTYHFCEDLSYYPSGWNACEDWDPVSIPDDWSNGWEACEDRNPVCMGTPDDWGSGWYWNSSRSDDSTAKLN